MVPVAQPELPTARLRIAQQAVLAGRRILGRAAM
jgi:hypothetical protein